MAWLCDIPTTEISSVFHQNSSHLSVSKNTSIVFSVHVLGGMIPQCVVDADALLQSSKRFVCALDSHEKLHSRPKSSDVFRWVISSTTLCTPDDIRNIYAGLFSEDPLAANQILCFQSLASLNTHMKIMKIYRENISLTVNPPPPQKPLHFIRSISPGRKNETKVQSWKFKVLWIIVKYSFMSESILKSVRFTSLVCHIWGNKWKNHMWNLYNVSFIYSRLED